MAGNFGLVELAVVTLTVAVVLYGVARRARSSIAGRVQSGSVDVWRAPFIMFLVGAATTGVLSLRWGIGPSPWSLLNSGLLAVLVYQLMRGTRNWLRAATLLLYAIVAWVLTAAIGLLLNAVEGRIEWFHVRSLLDPIYYLRLVTGIPDNLLLFALDNGIVVGTAYYLIMAPANTSRHAAASWSTPRGHGGQGMETTGNEVTRLALASALLGGSLFRSQVVARVRDRFRATTPELGLDYKLLLNVCVHLERRETKYQIWFVLLGLGVLLALGLTSVALFTLLVLVVFEVYFFKRFEERFRMVPLFARSRFDPKVVAKRFPAPLDRKLEEGLPRQDQNVVVYAGFAPFVGAGFELGGWSVAVDVTRPTQQLGRYEEPTLFAVSELYDALEAATAGLQMPGMTSLDCVFVSGLDVRTDSMVLPDRFGRPVQHLDPTAFQRFATDADSRIRRYKWIRVFDWGNELVLSYFVRFGLQGRTLFVEVSRFLLTPLDDRYRAISRIALPHWRSHLAWALGTALGAPFAIPLASLGLVAKLARGLEEALGTRDRARRREIATNPQYDYGAGSSLRQAMSSALFLHYFQKMDKDMYEKSLERHVLDTVVDFLDAHHIDVSELRERQSTILNTGIIVQGGDVTAQTLAVGTAAKAGVFKRFTAGAARPAPARAGAAR